MLRRQSGFTLAEVLVSTAIAFALGWLLLRLVESAVGAAALANARTNAANSSDRLAERLDADASSAWSVFVPDADVAGNANGDGHELDFASEDASHAQYWWAYDYDAASQTVTQYAYEPGNAARAVQAFDGIARFVAKGFNATALTDRASGAYDPLFAGATVSNVDFDFGWNPRALGGNPLVRVALNAAGVERELVLSSATAPSHFTAVVQYTPPP